MKNTQIIPVEAVENKILLIRGQKVMIDRDLARLYGVPTKVLNQKVKRNIEKFPADFMFILTKAEKDELVTNCDRFNSLKHSTALPYAFTEHGALIIKLIPTLLLQREGLIEYYDVMLIFCQNIIMCCFIKSKLE